MKERRDLYLEEHKEIVILSDFVFTHEDGMPFYPGSFSRAFKKAARKVGLPDMRLHNLRHAYASYLIDMGENPKTVQELPGHVSVHFTLKKYVKAISESKRKANDKMIDLYKMNKKE